MAEKKGDPGQVKGYRRVVAKALRSSNGFYGRQDSIGISSVACKERKEGLTPLGIERDSSRALVDQ